MRDTITQGSSSTKQWRIQGRGPGDPAPRLILDQNEARRAEKHFFEPALPPLSEGLDDRPPLPPTLSESMDPPQKRLLGGRRLRFTPIEF